MKITSLLLLLLAAAAPGAGASFNATTDELFQNEFNATDEFHLITQDERNLQFQRGDLCRCQGMYI